MGRFKVDLGRPSGTQRYWDPADSGPDQNLPDSFTTSTQAAPNVTAPAQNVQPTDGNEGPTPGVPDTPPETGTPAPPATTSPSAPRVESALSRWARPALQANYQKYLGRAISEDEFWSYVGPNASQQSVQQAIDAVRLSAESAAFQRAHPELWGKDYVPPAAPTSPTEPTTPGGGTGTKGDYAGFGQAWLASGGRTPDQLKAFVAAHPEYGAVIFGSKGSKVTIGGRSFDAIFATSDPANARGSWDDITNGGGGNAQAKPDPNSLSGNAAIDKLIATVQAQLLALGQGNSVTTTGPGGGTDPHLRESILAALEEMITQGRQPVGDVSGTPQAKAYALATQRNAEKNRSAAAEHRASQGLLYSGPLETDVNAIQQQQSQQQAGYEAQLTTTILEDRKAKLTTALQQGAGIMATDQQMALTKELQSVNREIQKAQIQIQLAQALMANDYNFHRLGFDIGNAERVGNENAATGGG